MTEFANTRDLLDVLLKRTTTESRDSPVITNLLLVEIARILNDIRAEMSQR